MNWRAEAVCARLKRPDAMYPAPADREAVARARAVCEICPVSAACLEAALADEGGRTKDFRWGIRAGKTPSQRHCIHKARRSRAKADEDKAERATREGADA